MRKQSPVLAEIMSKITDEDREKTKIEMLKILNNMTQEDKELLLKDLCARLPYGVKCEITTTSEFSNKRFAPKVKKLDYLILGTASAIVKGYECNTSIKPYLFPMSSMTEEQKEEYYHIVNYISPDDTETWMEGEFIYVDTTQFLRLINFYHRNHLDYRGLINGGLALDATGLNIY